MLLTILSAAAATLALGTAAWKGIRWTQRHVVVARPQDPAKPVEKLQLSYLDVEHGVERLTEYARSGASDTIVGINRGGAIIGGLQARRLNISRVYLVDVHEDDQGNVEAELLFSPDVLDGGEILLVDEVMRSGRSFRAARRAIEAQAPNSRIRCAVLLENVLGVPRTRPRRTDGLTPDYSVFKAYDTRVALPWEAGFRA